MQEELKKIVLKYMNERKNIDNDYIKEIIMIASDYYSLNEYIKNIQDFGKYWPSEAAYGIDNKCLITNLHLILQTANCAENELVSLKKSKAFKYLHCMHALLHEVEHAQQQKILHEHCDIVCDTEREILQATYFPIYKAKEKIFVKSFFEYKKLEKLINKFYIFSPSERLAEIKSYEYLQEISKLLEDEICYDFMQYCKLYNLLRGYNVGLINNMSDNPTKYYLQQVNPDYDFDKILKMSEQLDSETSIKLGLQSSSEELDQIAQKNMQLILKLNNHKTLFF